MDNPRLKENPVVVGSGEIRCIVPITSYKTRQCGIKSAIPIIVAKNRCKDFFKPVKILDIYISNFSNNKP